MQTDIVILGAGLTGLCTAFNLQKKKLNFIVLEKENRVGGVIRTQEQGGFVYEGGPNSGVYGNTEVVKLFDELEGKCELQIANEAVKKRYILKGGQWNAIPSGPLSAITTPLFTLADKFRLLCEPFRKRGENPHETLSELVVRRMGKSFLDFVIDPFILGVYAGDPSRLVPKYALPKLYDLEQKYGSFIGGAIKKGKEPKTELEKRVTREVFSVVGGLQKLTDAISDEIGAEKVKLAAQNIEVSTEEGGFLVRYETGGIVQEIHAKQVITTTGAYALPKLLPFADQTTMKAIASLHHTRVVELQIGYSNWDGFPLDGFGGLIPFKEKRDILGVMFMSSLVDGRAPKKGALFAVFVGGVRRQDMYEKSDQEVEEIALREFSELMQTSQKPDMVQLQRYEHAIPQYYADSGERFAACDTLQQQHPGLWIGGNLRDGIGMADRIQQAAKLADLAFDFVRK